MAVVGASGYAGGEVVRLLAAHPHLEATTLCAHTQVGESVAQALPHLGAPNDQVFAQATLEALRDHDAVILGLPHGHSAELAAKLRAQHPEQILVDLGADHRLDDPEAWEQFYGTAHAGTWTYGMPELPRAEGPTQRERLAATTQIAVPGCNATALTFAALPLLQHQLVDPQHLSAVLAVGYSGAGKTPKPHLQFAEAIGGATPYNAGGQHRHIPEILQNLALATGTPRASMALTMTPVLVPMSRGILAVLTAPLGEKTPLKGSADAVGRAFYATFAHEKLVTLLGENAYPNTGYVTGSAGAQLGWNVDVRSRTVTVMCAIDNLVKGTAGAALQSLNLALGLPEYAGIPTVGLHP